MKSLQLLFLLSGLLAAAVATFYIVNSVKNPSKVEPDKTEIQNTSANTTEDQTPTESDEKSLETTQKVSDDNSLDTINSELNNTVILNEDFSDL